MTLTDARPFAEHLRVLRERLQHLTGIGTDAEASAGGDAHLTVSPGHATITGSDTARAEIACSGKRFNPARTFSLHLPRHALRNARRVARRT